MVSFFKWSANIIVTAIISLSVSILGVYMTLEYTSRLEQVKFDTFYEIADEKEQKKLVYKYSTGAIKAVYLCNINEDEISIAIFNDDFHEDQEIKYSEISEGESFLIVYDSKNETSSNYIMKDGEELYFIDHNSLVDDEAINKIREKTGKELSLEIIDKKLDRVLEKLEILKK